MSKLIDYFSGRFDWRYRPGRSIVKNSCEPEQEATGDSGTSKQDKRTFADAKAGSVEPGEQGYDSEQDESYSKRVDKNYKCVTDPFRETLRLLDELF